MTPSQLGVASLAVAVGACLQSSVGFGLNLVAAPVLIAVDHRLVPGPAALLSLVLTILVAHREREAIDVRGVGWALLGRVPGTVLGALTVAVLSERGLDVGFSLLLLVAVALSASGYALPRTPPTLVGVGALSGFMGTTTSIGGPPMSLIYQDEEGATIRGTLAGFLMVGISLSLVSLALVGRFGVAEAEASAALLPALLVGFTLSRWTAPRLDGRHTRTAVLVVSAASAVALLARDLFSY